MSNNDLENKRKQVTEALLGSGLLAKPTPVSMETIEVVLSTDDLIDDYADTLVRTAYLRHPAAVDQAKLTTEEVERYFRFLIHKRIAITSELKEDTRGLQNLWIPCFLELVLTSLGRVSIPEIGVTLVPVEAEPYDDTYTLQDAQETSFKLGALQRDLHMVSAAMPREKRGNLDVMMTALIQGHVRAIKEVDDPLAPWLSRFIGLKLKEEVQFSALYRISYDSAELIKDSLYLNDRIM